MINTFKKLELLIFIFVDLFLKFIILNLSVLLREFNENFLILKLSNLIFNILIV